MRLSVISLATVIVFSGITVPLYTHAQFDSIVKEAQKVLSSESLGVDEIARGLKEALQMGVNYAVENGSQIDGYYKNPSIKILLPEKVQQVEPFLRGAGFDSQVDAFELSMNRAAEKAAPQATKILSDAIIQMSFSDAETILKGPDNAATLYFKDKTFTKLQEIFKPKVHDAMSEVGVTRLYQNLENKVKKIPFAGTLDVDLDQYVTDRSLDGLFTLIEEGEKKIRQVPSARTTDLLKKVFGNK